MNYKNSAAVDSDLQSLTQAFPNTCAMFHLDNPTHNGVRVGAVRIQQGTSPVTPVLFTGGVHGCELAPPDALLSFCRNLLTAYDKQSDIDYPIFTDTDGTVYGPYTVDNATVVRILSSFRLFVVPCVNPDGRDYALPGATEEQQTWRKNRRPGDCIGVDINRNFPLAWDADTYYNSDAASDVNTSTDPCDLTFRGYPQAPPLSGPVLEPETTNLIHLVAQQGIQYLVDVHMFGRMILFPWGMDTAQSTQAQQTFYNTAFDRQRDGLRGTSYGEYVPNGAADRRPQLWDTLRDLADAMAAEISRSAGSSPTAVSRSAYNPKQSVGLYPTTGAFDDYTFGQQFLNGKLHNTYAFTLECGNERRTTGGEVDDDGGFAPPFATKFPKVEREVHAALFGLLAKI